MITKKIAVEISIRVLPNGECPPKQHTIVETGSGYRPRKLGGNHYIKYYECTTCHKDWEVIQ